MSEEIPQANPPLNAEEQAVAARLSPAELQAIDTVILANAAERWLKVAWVVLHTADAMEKQHPGLSCLFYAQRLCQLAAAGRLESKGNLAYMRFSEVRLPIQTDSKSVVTSLSNHTLAAT